jgi:Protein of unknown function (DUF2752)
MAMNYVFLFYGNLNIANWVQSHLLPCPFKKITGIDCPGCGFQRSLIALIKGDISNSFHLYPATIPLLVTTLFVFLALKLNFDKRHILKKTLYIITGGTIMISYILKLYNLYV